jgi:hypothetical protein
MSDASVAGRRPIPFDARKARENRSDSGSPAGVADAVETAAVRPSLLRRLRTMGGVDLRGMAIEITPAEIEEDLRYGRD